MSIEIRVLTADDVYIHRQLMNHAFAQGRIAEQPTPEQAEDEVAQFRGTTWGLFENGALKASVTSEDFVLHWGEATTLAMGGLAGVATFAEARGRGFVDQLLRESLLGMRAKGQFLSTLYPFAWAFYRKQGWDWVGEKRELKIPLAELKATVEGRDVQLVSGTVDEVREKLSAPYTTMAQRYRSMSDAGTHRWDRELSNNDNKTTYVYQYPATGAYLLWRYEGNESRVRRFVASDAASHRALLGLLHYFGTQCEFARLTLPADSPIWSTVMHWRLETRVWPVYMARLVDFAAAMNALGTLPGVPNGVATLALTDAQAPWNEGVWRIIVEAGNVSCSAVVGNLTADADITADIQALSQAFWGSPSLAALRFADRVIVRNEAAFAWLCQVLPATPVFTMDEF